ncbi:MAG: hypothetical protein LBR69_07050 [Endomicrobium sp.]|jgi:hypothetical protein|nr:hypothetical protein [Endomicrobium sp.]
MNLKKGISLTISLALLLTAPASAAQPYAAQMPFAGVYDVNGNFSVNVFNADRENRIILIQDLHCHFGAQKKIAAFLEDLSGNPYFDKIYIEGSSKDISGNFIKNLPQDIKNPFAQELLKQGRISGAEYFFLTSAQSPRLYGLENEELYSANAIRLGYIFDTQKQVKEIINDMASRLNALQKSKLDYKSRKILALAEKHEEGKITSGQYYGRLFEYAKTYAINAGDYPALKTILDSQKRTDAKKVQKQLAEFLSEAKEVLPYNAYRELTKRNIISNILPASREYPLNLDKYGELSRYASLYERMSALDITKLYAEEKNLLNAVLLKTSKAESVETVILSLAFGRLKKFAENKAAGSDFGYTADFSQEVFETLWNKLSDKGSFARLAAYLETYKNFYAANEERNSVFADKIPFDADGKSVNAVITGGFHTEALKNMLLKKGFGVTVLTPKIGAGTREAEEKYAYLFAKLSEAEYGNFTNQYALKAFLSQGNETLLPDSLKEISSLYRRGAFGEKTLAEIMDAVVEVYNRSAGENEKIMSFEAGEKEVFRAVLKTAGQETELLISPSGQTDISARKNIPFASIFIKLQKMLPPVTVTVKDKFLNFISHPLGAPLWETAYLSALTAFAGPFAAAALFTLTHLAAGILLDANSGIISEIKDNYKNYLSLLAPSFFFALPFALPLSFAAAFAVSLVSHAGYNAFAGIYGFAPADIAKKIKDKMELYVYEEDEDGVPVCIEENKLDSFFNLSPQQHAKHYSGQKTILSAKINSVGSLIAYKNVLLPINDTALAGKEARIVIDADSNITEIYVINGDEIIKFVNANTENPEIPNMQRPLSDMLNPTVVYEYTGKEGGVPVIGESTQLNYFNNLFKKKFETLYSGRDVVLTSKLDSKGYFSLFGTWLLAAPAPDAQARIVINGAGHITEIYVMSENGPVQYVNANVREPEKTNMQPPLENIENPTTVYEYAGMENGLPVLDEDNYLNYFQAALSKKKFDEAYSGKQIILTAKVTGNGNLSLLGHSLINNNPDTSLYGKKAMVLIDKNGFITEIFVVTEKGPVKFVNVNFENPSKPNMLELSDTSKTMTYIYDYSGMKNGLPVLDENKLLNIFQLIAKNKYNNLFSGRKTTALARFSEKGSLSVIGYGDLICDPLFAQKEARAVINEEGFIAEVYVITEEGTAKYVNADKENPQNPNMQPLPETLKNPIMIYEYAGDENGIPSVKEGGYVNYYPPFMYKKTFDKLYSGRKMVLVNKLDMTGNLAILGIQNLVRVSKEELFGKEARIVVDEKGNITDVYILPGSGSPALRYTNANVKEPENPNMQPVSEEVKYRMVIYKYSGISGGIAAIEEANRLNSFQFLSGEMYEKMYSGEKTVIVTKFSPAGSLSVIGHSYLVQNLSMANAQARTVINEKGHVTEVYVINGGEIVKYVNANTGSPQNPNMQPAFKNTPDFIKVYEYAGIKKGAPVLNGGKLLNYFSKYILRKEFDETYSGKKIVISAKIDRTGNLSIMGQFLLHPDAAKFGGQEARIVINEYGHITEVFIFDGKVPVKYVNANRRDPKNPNIQQPIEDLENPVVIYEYSSMQDGVPKISAGKKLNHFRFLGMEKYNELYSGGKTVVTTNTGYDGILTLFGRKLMRFSNRADMQGKEARIVIDKKGIITEVYVMTGDGFTKYINVNSDNPQNPNMQPAAARPQNFISIYEYTESGNAMPDISKKTPLNLFRVLTKEKYMKLFSGKKTVVKVFFNESGELNILGVKGLTASLPGLAGKEARALIDENGYVTEIYIVTQGGPLKYVNADKENPHRPNMQPLFETIDRPVAVYEYSGMKNGIPEINENTRLNYFRRLLSNSFYRQYAKRKIVLTSKTTSDGSLNVLGFQQLINRGGESLADKEARIVIENGNITEIFIMAGEGAVKYVNANRQKPHNPNMQPEPGKIPDPVIIYKFRGIRNGLPAISDAAVLNYFPGSVSREVYNKSHLKTDTVIVTRFSERENLSVLGHGNLIYSSALNFSGKEVRTVLNKKGHISEIYVITENGPVKYVNANLENPEEPNMQPLQNDSASFTAVYDYTGKKHGIPEIDEKKRLNSFTYLSKEKFNSLYMNRSVVLTARLNKAGILNLLGYINLVKLYGREAAEKEARILVENGLIKEIYVLTQKGAIKRVNISEDPSEKPRMRLEMPEITAEAETGDAVENILSYIYELEILEYYSSSQARCIFDREFFRYSIRGLDKNFRIREVKEGGIVSVNGVKMKVFSVNPKRRSMTVEQYEYSDEEIPEGRVTVTIDSTAYSAKRAVYEELIEALTLEDTGKAGSSLIKLFSKGYPAAAKTRKIHIDFEEALSAGVNETVKNSGTGAKPLFISSPRGRQTHAMISQAALKMAEAGRNVLIVSTSGNRLDAVVKNFIGNTETPIIRVSPDDRNMDKAVSAAFGSAAYKAEQNFRKRAGEKNYKGVLIAADNSMLASGSYNSAVLKTFSASGFDEIIILDDDKKMNTLDEFLTPLMRLSHNGHVILAGGVNFLSNFNERDLALLKTVQAEGNELVGFDAEEIFKLFETVGASDILQSLSGNNAIVINEPRAAEPAGNILDFVISADKEKLKKYPAQEHKKINSFENLMAAAAIYGIVKRDLSVSQVQDIKAAVFAFTLSVKPEDLNTVQKARYEAILAIFGLGGAKPADNPAIEGADPQTLFLQVIASDANIETMIDSLKNSADFDSADHKLLIALNLLLPPAGSGAASGSVNTETPVNSNSVHSILSSS